MLGWPQAARGDTVSCSNDAASHTATVSVTPGARISTSLGSFPSGEIYTSQYEGGSSLSLCGAATMSNTDLIIVNNTSATRALAAPISVFDGLPTASGIGPGFTDEPGSSDEIEMQVNFGPGGELLFDAYRAGLGAADIALGGSQINLNASESDGIDADVTITGSVYVGLSTGAARDVIDGGGGSGTPSSPFRFPIDNSSEKAAPGANPDRLIGGNGNDHLTGGRGRDIIRGGNGRDGLFGLQGDDTIDGGSGRDTIYGYAGDDRLFGRAGNDRLAGQGGNDLLNGGAGRRDACDSRGGRDTLRACETD